MAVLRALMGHLRGLSADPGGVGWVSGGCFKGPYPGSFSMEGQAHRVNSRSRLFRTGHKRGKPPRPPPPTPPTPPPPPPFQGPLQRSNPSLFRDPASGVPGSKRLLFPFQGSQAASFLIPPYPPPTPDPNRKTPNLKLVLLRGRRLEPEALK